VEIILCRRLSPDETRGAWNLPWIKIENSKQRPDAYLVSFIAKALKSFRSRSFRAELAKLFQGGLPMAI
ncbi:unnamed protein product, partial [Acidithrix sp. C25]